MFKKKNIVLFLVFIISNISFSNEVNIEVKAMFGTENFILNKDYITDEGDTVLISQCKFYLTNFKFIYKSGEIYTEKDSYHLIDVSDSTSLLLHFDKVPKGKLERIDFCIGVDSLNSVSGALEGDLDPMLGMYWAWNSGYINAKMEGVHSAIKSPRSIFEFHIGGYLKPNKTIQYVQLEANYKIKSKPLTINLYSDLECWFSGLNVKSTNHILVPGREAVEMSNRYSRMFKLK